ncbi:branched-subunit amino acid transport protein AzlD [Lipingzhangella halophila]|uniref:Branched-subunit amino acid transport protein AzlD n=1 Tax=Lipingzhangella halophila TaxID=1783352 RepID=A0A7W7RHF5_9ACTN|nr:AzlD domain-containing protein [Lipingzhangella halophila]MBB4931673.1 branched-subunit amino acid transport protein AzlD [Lipingzhangella halophila]
MPDTGYLIAALLTAVAVTWALRALPFAAIAPLRSSPLAAYLATAMPIGVMAILAIYTLRTFSPHVPEQAWPSVLALACTVGLHLWRRNVVLSIFGGTAVHVVLASTLAAH